MLIGEYPCCDGTLAIECPEETPVYVKDECPHCGAKVWHKLSRVDPMSWTEADFLAEHDVDYDEKRITIKATDLDSRKGA